MAIDRIGKGGGLPASPEVQPAGGPSSTDRADAPFKVDRSEPARPENVEQVSAASPLGRLRSGEVDVHGYIDLKVDEATTALKGLSTSELDAIKSVLRDQMKSDPGLADLVRTATGKMPTPPED
jgi:hypothetical protein